MRNGIVSLLVLAVLAGPVSAGVMPIGEFTGDLYEGFENLGTPGGYPGPFSIMDGDATFNDVFANMLMIAYSLQSGLTGVSIYPYNGNLMGGSVTGCAVIEFTTPVEKFGGYIGAADDLTGGMVTFRDEDGLVLGTEPFSLTMGQWAWYGWESDVPFGSIEIWGAASPGLGVVFDDLQATVPEPAGLSLLAMGAVALLGSRRGVRGGAANSGNRSANHV
jgi:hypothetical protein